MDSTEKELTEAERQLIKRKAESALQLRLSQVVANDRDVYAPVKQLRKIQKQTNEGGFFHEDEPTDFGSSSQFEKDEEFIDDNDDGPNSKRKRRRPHPATTSRQSNTYSVATLEELVPIPPDQDKPICDQCNLCFETSFLRTHFDVDVCDRCRDPKGIHQLITKSTAKERYLLNDTDLDIREPILRYISKRNPHHHTWGDMRLYLEAQVAERSLTIWGSEEKLEEEKERRCKRAETTKLKNYNKKLNELKLQTRSSLYMKTHKNHEHVFETEEYDEEKDVYIKRCKECNYVNEFEKL